MDGRCLVRKIFAAGVLAFSGVMTTGVVISNADTIPVDGSYVTQTACLNDGTRFGQVGVGPDRRALPRFLCEQHNDGLWHLYLIR